MRFDLTEPRKGFCQGKLLIPRRGTAEDRKQQRKHVRVPFCWPAPLCGGSSPCSRACHLPRPPDSSLRSPSLCSLCVFGNESEHTAGTLAAGDEKDWRRRKKTREEEKEKDIKAKGKGE